jgi:2-keto-3-deoxy-L-fuconate dehydrogenase
MRRSSRNSLNAPTPAWSASTENDREEQVAGRLKDKIAVVTAAGQGIGRAIAEQFLAEGAIVHASDIDLAKLDGLEGAARSKLDVTSTAAVEAYAVQIGPIDVLVNVAGFVHHGTVLTTSEKDWDFSFDLNVKSMHRTIRAFLPGMIERAKASGRTSSIVNISSGASSVRGIPNRYAYGASKAAVIGLTKAVAADFIRDGIRCNAVAPGTFRSPSWEGRVEELGKSIGSKEQALKMFVERQPMGRVADAAEIAPVVVYLASDESAFCTGAVMAVDGGFSL